ncbi:MAG: GTA head formation protein, RCAP_rcc01685 family [Mangrovicoccus sp.]
MNDASRPPGRGSRFLFEPFQYGPKDLIAAQDKILEMKFDAVDARLARLEALMERLERRVWLTIYGVAGTILAQAAKTILTMTPNGGP